MAVRCVILAWQPRGKEVKPGIGHVPVNFSFFFARNLAAQLNKENRSSGKFNNQTQAWPSLTSEKAKSAPAHCCCCGQR